VEGREDRDTWILPRKQNILGVNVSSTTYDEILDMVIQAAKANISICVTHLAVHGLITGSMNDQFCSILNDFEIVAPDGQPVRYALNVLYNAKLSERCYGPEFMKRVCRQAALKGIGVYLYGSHPYVVEALRDNLLGRYPQLRIVGCEPSIFRPLTEEEDRALVNRINETGAGIVFLGLGCPLQEKFAHAHKGRIRAVLICVGAAFDFHAGNKKMAPVFWQRYALEWLFRLLQEPRRLWKRYLVTNTIFLLKILVQYFHRKPSQKASEPE
jgi:exopolysaccharide biosynthesis WecB/TagA/CpsF family protein